MKRHGKLKKTILFTLLVALLVSGASMVLERKDSVRKYRTFFEKTDDFDVLFFGTSHVVDDIYPMELWKDYGITSFNCGGDGNRVPTSYWTMRNCLDYASPDVAVIDGFWLSQEIKTSNHYSETHVSFDAFPLTATKAEAVYDLLDDPYYDEQGFAITEEREPIGLLWDFSVYHSRWTELTKDDFDLNASSCELGASTKVGYTPAGEITPVPADDRFEGDSVGVTYLEQMIRFCQSRGIQVVLTYLPFPAGADSWREANRLYEIAEQYQVPYINFLAMDGIVDYRTDTYDTNSHLNPSGAKKVTNYLGEFLSDEIGVKDHRGDAAYQDWEEMYGQYDAYKLSLLEYYTNFTYTTQMLSDRHYVCRVDLYNEDILEDAKTRADLENMEASGNVTVFMGSSASLTEGQDRQENQDKQDKQDNQDKCDVRITASSVDDPEEVIFCAEYWFEENGDGSLSNTRTEVLTGH